jgi:hypothetical protein
VSDEKPLRKMIDLKEIWRNYTFSSETVRGVRSMNDGKNYTVLERGANGTNLVQYNYSTGNKVSTIVDANWERVDTYGFDKIGTGMSESSGVFTFPSTGYWLVLCQIYYRATGGTNAFIEAYLQTTTDNSTYNNISTIIDGGQASNDYGGLYGSFIFDVTSTTTHKCRLSVAAQVSCQINGSTSSSFTSLTFIRLGDT